jgi:hypothetical protein
MVLGGSADLPPDFLKLVLLDQAYVNRISLDLISDLQGLLGKNVC